MIGFLKNLWKTQPNTVMGFGALLILIGFFNAVLQPPATQVRNKSVPTPKTNKVDPKIKLQQDIKYMKSCGKQLRIDRVNWYLDEMGITDNFERIKVIENTDLYESNKPYELSESYKSMYLPTKTGRDLPYENCAPDAKDKLPKDFLQRFGY